LSAIQEFTNLGGQSLSQATQIDQLFRGLADPFGLFFSRLVYYARKREAHLSFRQKTQAWARMVVDFNTPQRPRFRLSDRDTALSLWISTQKTPPSTQQMRLMAGDNTGQIWVLDQEATHKNGAGYGSRLQTMWHDIGLPTIDKNAEFLELHFNPTGQWPVGVKAWWDARLAVSTSVLVADPIGYTLGSWVLGTGPLADPSAVVFRRLKLTGGGRRLSLEIEQSAASQDFSLARAFLSYSPRGERAR
jgi:hypothetical protein